MVPPVFSRFLHAVLVDGIISLVARRQRCDMCRPQRLRCRAWTPRSRLVSKTPPETPRKQSFLLAVST